jgi:hypothetical protein
MTPTPKLRFVERPINICTSPDGTVSHGTMVRILQQWWEDHNVVLAVLRFGSNGLPKNEYAGEWRDVPLEEEKCIS